MSNATQSTSFKNRKTLTSEVQLSYPALLKAKLKYQTKDEYEYSALLLFKAGEDCSKPAPGATISLKELVRLAAVEKFGQANLDLWARQNVKNRALGIPPAFRTPFRDQAEKIKEEGASDGLVAGNLFVTVKSTRPPGIVNADNSRITEEKDIYGGCWVRCSVTAFPYGGPGTTYTPGVSLWLVNVQKLRDDTPFGGMRIAPEEEFAPVEDTGEGAIGGTTADSLI